MWKLLNILAFLLSLLGAMAQTEPKVLISIDSTHIRIGEQINYLLEVEADTTSLVMFPEGTAFSPLEVIESSEIDTVRKDARYQLLKHYGLTKFDSGAYRIPGQKVFIDGKEFLTDSLKVYVANVVVDTLKQQLYDIKPIITIPKANGNWWVYLLIGIGVLGLIGFLFWYFVLRKQPLTEEEKVALLPPYDRAMLAFKQLEDSQYLIQSDHKAYYSELTGIVRTYLEEETDIPALESTSDQLMDMLRLYSESEKLSLDPLVLKEMEEISQKADLVKFAKGKVADKEAEGDRLQMQQVVDKIRDGLPEPTEEELKETEEYVEELLRKKRRKRLMIGVAALFLLLVSTTAGLIGLHGFQYIKDTVLGHPTKELLEGDWVYSEYGIPPVAIQTPRVLRRKALEIPEDTKATVQNNQAFYYGSLLSNFYMMVSTTTFSQDVEFSLDKAIGAIVKEFEKLGAKNVLLKQEETTTLSGAKGVKAYGSMDVKYPVGDKSVKMEYQVLNFSQNGGYQQIIIAYERGDNYSEELVERIVNSIDFRSEGLDVEQN